MQVGDLVKVNAKYNRVKIGLVVEVATKIPNSCNGSGALYGYRVQPVDGTRPILALPQDMEIVNESR